MLQQLAPAFRMIVLLTILTGLIYPGVVTGLCQLFFKNEANGSLVIEKGHVIGSALLGQNFARPEYFHPRPSLAGNNGYDPTASGGSNLGPTSQKLYDRMKASAAQFRKDNPDYPGAIPADALAASGSGLDPEISVANAGAQAVRVANARGVAASQIETLIASATEHRDLGFLGEPRVNVLKLNLEIDRQLPKSKRSTRQFYRKRAMSRLNTTPVLCFVCWTGAPACFGQESATAPVVESNAHTTAIARELEAMKARISELEAELENAKFAVASCE